MDNILQAPARLFIHQALQGSYAQLAFRLARDLERNDRGSSVFVACVGDDELGAKTAAELTVALSQELEATVLLVDASFVPGQLDGRMGGPQDSGLGDLLGAEKVFKKTLQAAVQATEYAAIAFLSNRVGSSGRPARAEKIQQVLDVAGRTYQYVVVAGSVTQGGGRSLVFASEVDAVLLVAAEGKSRMPALEQARRLLEEVNAPRIGLVLVNR